MSAETIAAFGGSDLPSDRPFTRADALASGLSPRRLSQMIAAGLLRRPFRGVYVDAESPDTIESRSQILRLVVPEHAFVCDRTAAWLHGASQAMAPNEDLEPPVISCFRPTDVPRLDNGLVDSGERRVLPRDLVEIGGLMVTSRLRTALDLGRLQPTRDLRLAGMDAMLALGGFELSELIAEIPRFTGQRGVVLLRALAPLVDAGSQSFSESALRLRWYDGGLPRPELQVRVETSVGVFYVDIGVAGERFGAEYDGRRWHGSQKQQDHDAWRRGVLASECSWRLHPFTDVNVYGHAQDADVLLRAAWRKHREQRQWFL
jgi:hypothetical protein